jgi:hypothetical protein
MKWVRNVLFVIIALAIAGCGGGGGGGGSSAGGDSFVISLDSGTPITHIETAMGGGLYDPYIISMVNSGMTLVTLYNNWNPGITNFDEFFILMIDGTTTGDYPIEQGFMNAVTCEIGGVMYMFDSSVAHAGTITVDVHDTDRIQGIFAVNMEEFFNTSNKLRLEGSFDLKPGI